MRKRMFKDLEEKIKEYGLTLEQYESCLSDAYAKANHKIDMDWQEIIDKYKIGIHYDTLRKATQTIFGGAFVSEYFKTKYETSHNNDSYLNELRNEKIELQKAKQKMFDERTQLNKKIRELARTEEDLHYLEELIKNRAFTTLTPTSQLFDKSDNDLVVCVSDFHIGASNYSAFGCYDLDVAELRLNEYLSKIINIKNTHNAENVYVVFLGDLLNGEIHFTTQLENRENVTEQIQRCAELLSSFVYELSKNFNNVYVNGVAGNHSRTSFKDQVLRGNRLDNLIPWYIKASLSHITNISFIDEYNYDSTIGKIEIRGHEYWLVHGDWDSFNETGVSKLVMMIGYKPTGIFYGHLHRCSYDEICGVKIIRSGSFSGTGDDYCISRRIYGKASQMVSVVNKHGVLTCYPIEL